MGCTTLTSLPLGFMVPITPKASSNGNEVDVKKTNPVSTINTAPARSNRRRSKRHPHVPVNIVSTAEPSSMPVTITPMRVAL